MPAAEGQTAPVWHSLRGGCLPKPGSLGAGRAGRAGPALCGIRQWWVWSRVRGVGGARFIPCSPGLLRGARQVPRDPPKPPALGETSQRQPGAAAEPPAWCAATIRRFFRLIKSIPGRFMSGRWHGLPRAEPALPTGVPLPQQRGQDGTRVLAAAGTAVPEPGEARSWVFSPLLLSTATPCTLWLLGERWIWGGHGADVPSSVSCLCGSRWRSLVLPVTGRGAGSSPRLGLSLCSLLGEAPRFCQGVGWRNPWQKLRPR